MNRKPIDETAARVGAMLRQGCQQCHLSQADAATLLRVLPHELAEYEYGLTKIPLNVLEHIFTMSYKIMQIRILERRYKLHRKVLWKLEQAAEDKSQ